MQRLLLVAAACCALAACGGRTESRPAAVQARPEYQPRPVNSSSEEIWHLRVGLNVAALMCKGRGRVSVTGDYGRMLDRHRSLFASAHAAEQRRHGSGFERHETRLYNRFANQRNPEAFCRRASSVARQAVSLDSSTLARNASGLLAEID